MRTAMSSCATFPPARSRYRSGIPICARPATACRGPSRSSDGAHAETLRAPDAHPAARSGLGLLTMWFEAPVRLPPAAHAAGGALRRPVRGRDAVRRAVCSTPWSRTIRRRRSRKELVANGTVFDRLWDQQTSQLRAAAGLLARDFGFRAAVATHDRNTIESALANLRQRVGLSTAFIVDVDGNVTGLDRSARSRGGLRACRPASTKASPPASRRWAARRTRSSPRRSWRPR